MENKTLLKNIKGFGQLRALLSQVESGREEYLYPHLYLGDMWWIPDPVTGFSNTRSQHPWVIVTGYVSPNTSVVACPRISTYKPKEKNRGILTPANILPGLDKEGLLVLKHRQPFLVSQFQSFGYIGRLPKSVIEEIQDFYLGLPNGKIK